MPGHLLSVLEPSIVLQVNGDAGCPPGVTSDGGKNTAASFCLTVGFDPGKSSIQAATWNGRTVVSSRP